jgi:hypothetical protein
MIRDGVRCEATTGLTAHHLVPFRQTGSMDPKDGVCLCWPCHVECDRRLLNPGTDGSMLLVSPWHPEAA